MSPIMRRCFLGLQNPSQPKVQLENNIHIDPNTGVSRKRKLSDLTSLHQKLMALIQDRCVKTLFKIKLSTQCVQLCRFQSTQTEPLTQHSLSTVTQSLSIFLRLIKKTHGTTINRQMNPLLVSFQE